MKPGDDLGAVACLAGRRIGVQDASSSPFPPHREAAVAAELERLFADEDVKYLVCSAACGADILALELADELGIPATVVLPFDPPVFRSMSVTDRGGDWGARFDDAMRRAQAQGTVVELGLSPDNSDAFDRANEEIVSTAAAVSGFRHLAILVWDGEKQGEPDATAQLRDLATARGFSVREVSTLP